MKGQAFFFHTNSRIAQAVGLTYLDLGLAVGVFLFDRWLGVDKVTAACMALTSCFFLIVCALIFQCVRAFGALQGQYFAFLAYFRRYPMLAVAGHLCGKGGDGLLREVCGVHLCTEQRYALPAPEGADRHDQGTFAGAFLCV